MTGRGGRVPVVVRGRESRPHGEGEQVCVGLQAKVKELVDANYQADKAWLLDIQRKLYTWSRANPDDAYRDMWNWVTDPRNLRLAWRRVSGNRGARSSGADKVTVRDITRGPGVMSFLTRARRELRSGEYRPRPVRRIMIPKPGKAGKFRPLGIPTVKDRVVQAALLQVLEPIFEADFLSVSYGFRPKRACRDALEHIRISICPAWKKEDVDWPRPPYEWVIEGDIKGCFDTIDHHEVMTRLRRRVRDHKVGRIVRAFLKAGILHQGAFRRTKRGTPQGGILSPLLANIVLSAIEERYGRFTKWSRRKDGKPYAYPGQELRKLRRRERRAGRTVFLPIRYADDFVVLVYGTEDQACGEKEALAVFLKEELKLTLSPEKTHVTALTEGFVFLGHRIRLRWHEHCGYWPRLEIPKDRIKDLHRRIKHLTTRRRILLDLQDIIDDINPLLMGWGRYYQHCYGAKSIFARIDHYVWDRIWRWLKKKHPKTSRRRIYRTYWKRLPRRNRSVWTDERPVAIMADLKVGRHNLARLEYPDYAMDTGKPGA
jgi:RNA-directed DNA polymerase